MPRWRSTAWPRAACRSGRRSRSTPWRPASDPAGTPAGQTPTDQPEGQTQDRGCQPVSSAQRSRFPRRPAETCGSGSGFKLLQPGDRDARLAGNRRQVSPSSTLLGLGVGLRPDLLLLFGRIGFFVLPSSPPRHPETATKMTQDGAEEPERRGSAIYEFFFLPWWEMTGTGQRRFGPESYRYRGSMRLKRCPPGVIIRRRTRPLPAVLRRQRPDLPPRRSNAEAAIIALPCRAERPPEILRPAARRQLRGSGTSPGASVPAAGDVFGGGRSDHRAHPAQSARHRPGDRRNHRQSGRDARGPVLPGRSGGLRHQPLPDCWSGPAQRFRPRRGRVDHRFEGVASEQRIGGKGIGAGPST